MLRDQPEENTPVHEPGHLEEWYDKEYRANEGRPGGRRDLIACPLAHYAGCLAAQHDTPLPIRVTRPYAIAGTTSRLASELTTRSNQSAPYRRNGPREPVMVGNGCCSANRGLAH